MAYCSEVILEQYVNPVLAAIMSGLEDPGMGFRMYNRLVTGRSSYLAA